MLALLWLDVGSSDDIRRFVDIIGDEPAEIRDGPSVTSATI